MATMARIRATLTELKRVASVVVDPKAILMDWYKKIRHKPRPPPSARSNSSSRLKATSDDDHDLDDHRKKLIISMAVIAFAFGLYANHANV